MCEENTVTYKKRAVFFLDILGFRKKVERAVYNKKLINKINCCLNKIKNYSSSDNAHNIKLMEKIKSNSSFNNPDLQILTFSDSFVASVSCDEPMAVLFLAYIVQDIQFELLKIGLLSRGAGDVGDLIHQENGIMFGPAFNSAYFIESKIADKPRILIGKCYVDYFKDIVGISDFLNKDLFVAYDDGPYGINTFSWVDRFNSDLDKLSIINIINKILKETDQEIDENRYNQRVYSKLTWHQEMLMEAVERASYYENHKDRFNF